MDQESWYIFEQTFKSSSLNYFYSRSLNVQKVKKNADPTQQDEISDYITWISDTGIYMYIQPYINN